MIKLKEISSRLNLDLLLKIIKTLGKSVDINLVNGNYKFNWNPETSKIEIQNLMNKKILHMSEDEFINSKIANEIDNDEFYNFEIYDIKRSYSVKDIYNILNGNHLGIRRKYAGSSDPSMIAVGQNRPVVKDQ